MAKKAQERQTFWLMHKPAHIKLRPIQTVKNDRSLIKRWHQKYKGAFVIRIIRLLLLTSLVGLTGCTAYRDTVREFSRSLGAIQIRDIDEANYIRANLPPRLNMDAKSIRVSPGSHVSEVIVYGVPEKDQPAVLAQVEEFRSTSFMCYQSEPERKIPMKEIKVEFRN